MVTKEEKYKFVKGDKKRLARVLRVVTGIPARTICHIMKNQQIIDQLQ